MNWTKDDILVSNTQGAIGAVLRCGGNWKVQFKDKSFPFGTKEEAKEFLWSLTIQRGYKEGTEDF